VGDFDEIPQTSLDIRRNSFGRQVAVSCVDIAEKMGSSVDVMPAASRYSGEYRFASQAISRSTAGGSVRSRSSFEGAVFSILFRKRVQQSIGFRLALIRKFVFPPYASSLKMGNN